VSACRFAFRPTPEHKKISQAYLVGIRNFEIAPSAVKTGQRLHVVVEKIHELGELTLVEGKVFSEENLCLARGQIKLFAR